ncbi:tyrosine-type recombinase/integrase [Lysinibacillus fusiformis]|uniref:tyrosine-type recombinase/integrase n=1 Tax=Lysinibacillus fusiformis TaxID=28031 RepID=UPI00215AD4BC|nr:site-specific integrase [Lysinibacillus fusiformis]MCR8852863.1 site-specific integrase [Lysinibacillus fusiformis]
MELEIYKKNVRLAKRTIVNYNYYLKKFISYLSIEMNTSPEEICLDKVILLKDSSGRPLKYLPIDSTIIDNYFLLLTNKGYSVLKDNYKALMSFFRFLENNYQFENPMSKLKFQIKDYIPEKKFTKVLTRGNILKLLNSIITHSDDLTTDILLFTILISTGCRISEILNLKCKDIDIKNDTFLLKETKNKHQRMVFLRPNMGLEIQKYIKRCNRKDSDYLFMKNNRQYTRKEVSILLKKYLHLANLPTINVHGLRHTFATLMADQETPLDIIRQLLGHESLASTKGYINPHFIRNKHFNIPENEIIIEFLKKKYDMGSSTFLEK